MAERLLVRLYNVGCGDCILVRVPDAGGVRHILIDAGNYSREPAAPLRDALSDVVAVLNDPALPAERRGVLDLLVATHRHLDHIKAFDDEASLALLRPLRIERIWLSTAMDPAHPQGPRLRALQQRVATVTTMLRAFGLVDDDLHGFLMNGIGTTRAAETLGGALPEANGIRSLYVYRGVRDDLETDDARSRLDLFTDPATRLHILGPEHDIDAVYLGAEPRRLLGALAGDTDRDTRPVEGEFRRFDARGDLNISRTDFRRLRARLLQSALSFAWTDNHLMNNTSVVLLLEWRGRRLLFTGDAEWTGATRPGADRGSWDVMWARDDVRALLSAPLDFLKVGHHGSRNATPWDIASPDAPINAALDALLPAADGAAPARGQAVVSTRSGIITAEQNPVPKPEILAELGRRVSNARAYADAPTVMVPPRTDLEGGRWFDVEVDAGDG
jgi:beta-lactamase superfamily II metal-dependent hydrolase